MHVEIHHHHYGSEDRNDPDCESGVMGFLRDFKHDLFKRLLTMVTVENLDAVIGPLTSAVQGLVTIVSDEPARIGAAVAKALADAQVADDEAQQHIDAAVAAATTLKDQALAAAQLNTGTPLPPPVEVPPEG
jgi:hypothetical protein